MNWLAIIFTLIFFLAALLVTSEELSWGVWLVVFLLPFERIGAYSLAQQSNLAVIRLVQIASLALMLVTIWRVIRHREKFRLLPLPLLLFAASAFISALYINNLRVWQNYVWLLFVLAIFWTFFIVTNQNRLRAIRNALFSSAAVVSLFGLFQFFGDLLGLSPKITQLRSAYVKSILGYPRVQSTAIEPLNFANYLQLPLLTGFALSLKQKLRGRLSPILLLIVAAFLATTSRGAFIAIVPAVLIVFYFMLKETVSLAKPLLITVVILLAISATGMLVASKISTGSWLTGPKTYARLFSEFTHNASFQDRNTSSKQVLPVCAQHLWFGVGVGRVGTSRIAKSPIRAGYDAINLQNTWLETYCGSGIVGSALFVWFLLWVWWQSWKAIKLSDDKTKPWLVGLLAASVGIILQTQSFSGFYVTYIWVTLGMLAGLSQSVLGKKSTS